MGFDIHCVFQAKVAARWVDVASDYKEDRDYPLYSWLGIGCGDRIGTCTIEPLAPPRGFPADFEIVDDVWHPTLIELSPPSRFYPGCRLMGEWGFSWLLSSEILGALQAAEAPAQRGGPFRKVRGPSVNHANHQRGSGACALAPESTRTYLTRKRNRDYRKTPNGSSSRGDTEHCKGTPPIRSQVRVRVGRWLQARLWFSQRVKSRRRLARKLQNDYPTQGVSQLDLEGLAQAPKATSVYVHSAAPVDGNHGVLWGQARESA